VQNLIYNCFCQYLCTFSLNQRKQIFTLILQEYNPFFYLWIIAQVISSSYAYAWDIKKDWGLMDQNPGDNPLLREEMVYNSKIYYYFAILEDFVLRFRWSVDIALKAGTNQL
jgi:hypothetical protein